MGCLSLVLANIARASMPGSLATSITFGINTAITVISILRWVTFVLIACFLIVWIKKKTELGLSQHCTVGTSADSESSES